MIEEKTGVPNRPTQYELLDKDGKVVGISPQIGWLHETAKRLWPDQEQDPDRTGKGWDVQVVGS